MFMRLSRRRTARRAWLATGIATAAGLIAGCQALSDAVDRHVEQVIEKRQKEALSYRHAAPIGPANVQEELPAGQSYVRNPSPTTTDVPSEFQGVASQPASAPASAAASMPTDELVEATSQPDSMPARQHEPTLTLTDAFYYALRHRREYQTAKEDLYLATLALLLERHLWTPQFAADLRSVYGNYGEIRDFDQAMRFVSELSMSQRLPYGGEFTAQAVSTLIRDVKKSITASEGSTAGIGLNIPFLRGAGMIAQEQLIQLERSLSYAVRDFERFRRSQLVDVAQGYFDLLRSKQTVLDNNTSLLRFRQDLERAIALQEAGTGTLLDAQRAEQQVLTAENQLEVSREAFRSQADDFKLLIGMPVDEPLGLDDLQDIDTIERQVAEGRFPLLLRPLVLDAEEHALTYALAHRFDLLNRRDQIEDARRGVANARNGLLPDLNWTTTATWDTDPAHYRVGDFSFDRTTWRSELVLGLPIERYRELTAFRTALIDVRRAERASQDLVERVRAEVRRAINRVKLAERTLQIQQRNLVVAELRREFARDQFYDGDIGNRDLFEAEDEWTNARNGLNLAKTGGWTALLEFRLATETLRIDDDGAAEPDEPAVIAGP